MHKFIGKISTFITLIKGNNTQVFLVCAMYILWMLQTNYELFINSLYEILQLKTISQA